MADAHSPDSPLETVAEAVGEQTTKAFEQLGNETRLAILLALWESYDPHAEDNALQFSELREAVGMRDSGQFNYHLNKLEGQFIAKSNTGYVLRQAGRRVVEAVLSGVITEDPVLEPTPVDFECLLCGAPIEVSYAQEQLRLFCTECPGIYDAKASQSNSDPDGEYGFLGQMGLPPAGIKGRTAEELLAAASTWSHLEMFSAAHGICPRCSAIVEHSVTVCEDHDASDQLCSTCQRRYAVRLSRRCSNCRYGDSGVVVTLLLGNLALRMFIGEHGIDPLAEGIRWGWDFQEDVISVDPFEARFTFALDGDAITLTVDDELAVTDIQIGGT